MQQIRLGRAIKFLLVAIAAALIWTIFVSVQHAQSTCDPSYPTVCIPPPPPDLDCRDIPYRNFPVRPPDPHHFDGGPSRGGPDGIGCETPR